MRLLAIIFSWVTLFQINVLAELSSNSCTLLRTASSLTTIIPEIAQLAIRYYRFLFNEYIRKKMIVRALLEVL